MRIEEDKAKPGRPAPSSVRVPGSGTAAVLAITVKFWFAPLPHVHSYVPGVTPRGGEGLVVIG
jgi:DNA-nicking Smr family endonuclease